MKRGEVKRIDVAEDKLTIEIPGRGKFTARKERNDTVPDLMASYGVSPAEFERGRAVLTLRGRLLADAVVLALLDQGQSS